MSAQWCGFSTGCDERDVRQMGERGTLSAGATDLLDGRSDRLLGDITQLLLSEGSLERVLEAVADGLREFVPHETLTLYRADLQLRVLRPVLVRHRSAAQILARGPLPFGSGITGWAAETRIPQLVEDARNHPRAERIEGTPDEPEALIAVPLVARDELKGVLGLYRQGQGKVFSEVEFERAIRFAGVAALAIDNAEVRAHLEAQVATDPLTGLFNHRHFYERLAAELGRASVRRDALSLVLYDVDDLSKVNAAYGHLVGDQVLQSIAAVSREAAGDQPVICRIGGEEFALIIPGAHAATALGVADGLRLAIADTQIADAGTVTISAGVAEAPLHASAARDLVACADAALRAAKGGGKDRVEAWGGTAPAAGDRTGGRSGSEPHWASAIRPADLVLGDEVRSVAHLKLLQSLARKLNRLNDVAPIGETITAELRSLIDYHTCRVHLLQRDGVTLRPIAFRGELIEYQGQTFDALVTTVGTGITGHVAETGRSFYTPNATLCEFAVVLPGTKDVVESILCVPLRYGDRVIGTITLSKLGIDQFDGSDLRLLEVLASHAAVAFENARLLGEQREAAEISTALLALSQRFTRSREIRTVLHEALDAVPTLIPCSTAEAWLRRPDGGGYVLAAHRGYPAALHDWLSRLEIPAELADAFIGSFDEPFVIPKELLAGAPQEFRRWQGDLDVLGVPMRWDPDGLGGIAVVAISPDAKFSHRDMRLARGVADIASLAVANAERYTELERAYVSTIEALANALEAKDESTSDHARALAEMALTVGGSLGLEGEDLKRLEISALFHDIGKIGVPSEIIRKDSALTAEERRIMQQHPEIGEQILAPVPFLQPIRPIIRACHERWDGKGYPDGLVGDAIPLEARIVFVCDAFHAMTTDRPYRAALADSEAVRRLKLSAGTQFDPAIVETFVTLYRGGKIHFHRH
jgi:diguanylate cyclase (GGDEF)-like protein